MDVELIRNKESGEKNKRRHTTWTLYQILSQQSTQKIYGLLLWEILEPIGSEVVNSVSLSWQGWI
jgi:hypothetical protein